MNKFLVFLFSRLFTFLVVFGASAFLFGATASAATCTWSGDGVDSNWSNTANWACGTPGVIPGTGDDVVFDATGNYQNPNYIYVDPSTPATSLNSILVQGGNYNVTNSGGGVITLMNGFSLTGGNMTFTSDLALAADQTFSSNTLGSILYLGKIDLGNYDLTFDTSVPGVNGIILMQGILGSGKVIKNGNGDITFSASLNIWTGGLQINQGRVSGSAIGTNHFNNPGPFTINAGASLVINSDEQIGSLSGSGYVVINGGPHVIDIYQNQSTTFSADIQGGATNLIRQYGTGTLSLTAPTITYAGAYNIFGSTSVLQIVGSTFNAPFTVNGRLLLSNGADVGTIAVNNNGILELPSGSAAQHCSSLTLSSGATLRSDIASAAATGYGKIVVEPAGTINLGAGNATLSLTSNNTVYTPLIGDVFNIITNQTGTAITGNFTGLAAAQTVNHNGTQLSASYTGGAGNDFTLTGAAALLTPTVTFTANVNPSSAGQLVTYDIDVDGGTNFPTGTVTLYDNGNPISSATLAPTATPNLSAASISTSALSVGTHPITVGYGGDVNFSSATSSATNQVVNINATTTTLGTSINPSKTGQSLDFTATVTGANGTPAGTITFQDGGSTLGTANLNGSGVATLTVSNLAVGSHPITAIYGGNASYSTSTSSALTQVVQSTGGGGGGGGGGSALPLQTVSNPSQTQQSQPQQQQQQPATACGNFTDMDSARPEVKAICEQLAYASKFGFTRSYFGPQELFDRSAALKIVLTVTKSSFDSTQDYCKGVKPFHDVTPGVDWVAQYACYAKINGYVFGYTDGNFKPYQQVSEVELSAIILRILDTTHKLYDSQASAVASGQNWFQPYVDFLNAKGVTTNPTHGMNRLESLDLLYRMYKATIISGL